jgi:broad specificity phosphatase PhoE
VRPTQIWSSPLPRALDLAKGIKEAFEAHVDSTQESYDPTVLLQVRAALEEKSFGTRECTRQGRHVSGFPMGTKPFESISVWTSRVKEEGREILDTLLSQTEEQTRNHIVVVTHGLWISAFFKEFLDDSVRLPFADNTGIFTLAVTRRLDQSPLKFQVICANDTSHLAGLKRQRGGIGSSASDKRQRKLGDMWTKKI